MFRFLFVAALAVVAVSGASLKEKEYTVSIKFNKLHELQDLNKIFKPLAGYKVDQVAIRDDVKAVVTVKESLKDQLTNYLNAHKIEHSFKLKNLFSRAVRDVSDSLTSEDIQDLIDNLLNDGRKMYKLNTVFKNFMQMKTFIDAHSKLPGFYIEQVYLDDVYENNAIDATIDERSVDKVMQYFNAFGIKYTLTLKERKNVFNF